MENRELPSFQGKYWQERQDCHYYQKVLDWLSNRVHQEGSLLDVGGGPTPIIGYGNFSKRTVIDLNIPTEKLDGVEYIKANFQNWDGVQHDVVICLQVLEHLSDDVVGQFAKKLFDVATQDVIITVPYQWPAGKCHWHQQDPIDLDKLKSWTQIEPDELEIIKDGEVQRMCALYKIRKNEL